MAGTNFMLMQAIHIKQADKTHSMRCILFEKNKEKNKEKKGNPLKRGW